jgi:SMC interacting uncharacterized protein involved in chromosome segregation
MLNLNQNQQIKQQLQNKSNQLKHRAKRIKSNINCVRKISKRRNTLNKKRKYMK